MVVLSEIECVQGEGRSEPVQEAKPMSMTKSEVCVIIAAKNAARTIAVAIASALREPEVVEVVVGGYRGPAPPGP
ncbi:hypothetical protein LB568_30780, partial [Mesorhizobium sp. B263B2A]|nr:hypothetical protein [Mesorhizobium sp. B263B2A]